jgi:hypothetical protein
MATEDLNGVWEAWWIANGLRPTLPLSARLRLAEQSLLSLVNDGLVSIARGSWDSHVEVPRQDVQQLLGEYDTWVASEQGDLVFFEATDYGRRAYGLPVE